MGLTVNVTTHDDVDMRYVVLHHVQSTSEHWDFMIEQADALSTWQLSANPVSRIGASINGCRIQDHRKHYLEYEGDISVGRGRVTRVADGIVDVQESSENLWRFSLSGTLSGTFQLMRLRGNQWRLEPISS